MDATTPLFVPRQPSFVGRVFEAVKAQFDRFLVSAVSPQIQASGSVRRSNILMDHGKNVVETFEMNTAEGKKLAVRKTAKTDEARKNIAFEKACLEQAQGPNVIKLLEAGEDYIVMEHGGSSILDELKKARQLNPDKALTIPLPVFKDLAWQLVNGLDHMHAKKVTHCDIKPENLLVDQLRQLSIIDFDIACSDTVPPTEEVCTVGYRPPELYYSNIVSDRADVFAAGATLYEMLTGNQLFPASRKVKVHNFRSDYERYLEEKLQQVYEIDPELVPIFKAMLCWNYVDRPSANQLRLMLGESSV